MAGVPLTPIERFDSGSGSLTSSPDGAVAREVEVKWVFGGEKGYDAAEAKAVELAPLYYGGHVRSRLEVRGLGNGWYEATANYGNANLNALENIEVQLPGDVKFAPGTLSFDTTGATEHITQAWSDSNDPSAYVQKNAASGFAPDPYGAINANGDQVSGVDITVPSFQFTESWHVPTSYLLYGQSPYIKTIYQLTGTVNSAPFRIFQAGEVLFLGARLDAARTQSMSTVTYSFSARLNRDNFAIGDVSGIYKAGWDYLWVEYKNDTDSDYGIKKPNFVYVARVYERKNFAALNLGTAWPALALLPPNNNDFTHPLDDGLRGVY